MKSKIFFYALLAIFSFSATSLLQAREDSPGRLVVYTVNYPLKYFAERIAGERAEVVFPAPADGDPAFWMPAPETITAYQRADLILLNGAGYAKWVDKVSLPRLRLVDTSAAFKDQYINVTDAVTHSHGPGGDHAHAGTAFTTWLDFTQAAQQAKAVMAALSRKQPQSAAEFERNYAALEEDLLRLDREIEQIVARHSGQPLVASHPVYQYLARRYGLNLKSVMWEPDVVPSEAQWQELGYGLKAHAAKWMIWEGEPNTTSVERLESLGVGSLVFDPRGNTPEKGDFMLVMQQNLRNLKAAFE